MALDNRILENLKNHPHWGEASAVFHRLASRGYCVYWAGGCVRDALLGRRAKDLDIATDADPDQVLSLFPGSLEIGKSFGVVMVPFKGFTVEVTRFRSDGVYTDGRHPEQIVKASPAEDALRRDFTVNALFFDGHRVIDYVEGLKDLERGVIRCVGDPETRFSEDHLRVLRALRFSVELGFSIESQTLRAVESLASLVRKVSIERVVGELEKMMSTPKNYEALNLIKRVGLGPILFGELGGILNGQREREFTLEKMKFVMAQTSQKRLSLFMTCLILFNFKPVETLDFLSSPSPNTFDSHSSGSLDSSKGSDPLSLEEGRHQSSPFHVREYLNSFKFSNAVKREILDGVQAFGVLTKEGNTFEALQILDTEKGSLFFELSQLFLKAHNQPDEVLLSYQREYERSCGASGRLPKPLLKGEDLLKLGLEWPLDRSGSQRGL